jgi:hypothetical protein
LFIGDRILHSVPIFSILSCLSTLLGEQLLSQIDSLGSYVKLKQEYRAAREKARPALKMFEEAGLSEDDAPTLE